MCVCVCADVLEDTAIGSVGEVEGGLGPLLEQNEGNRDREYLDPPQQQQQQQQQQQVVRHKRKSLENTPGHSEIILIQKMKITPCVYVIIACFFISWAGSCCCAQWILNTTEE